MCGSKIVVYTNIQYKGQSQMGRKTEGQKEIPCTIMVVKFSIMQISTALLLSQQNSTVHNTFSFTKLVLFCQFFLLVNLSNLSTTVTISMCQGQVLIFQVHLFFAQYTYADYTVRNRGKNTQSSVRAKMHCHVEWISSSC